MPQNPYFVTATLTTVRNPQIKHIIDSAIQITNIEDDLEEYLRDTEDVNLQYVERNNALVREFKGDLKRRLLRFFDDHNFTTVELNAITQTGWTRPDILNCINYITWMSQNNQI